uniref:Uncharacterized protein n=1 Tax=Kalanchoe fedtschenkoi TaxID=63787 RepID=A0A7N0UL49_KALFE
MAISGFKTHAFRRMDQQIEFMKQLVSHKIFNTEAIINDKNNCGRTALHLAIIGNIHSDLIHLLMSVNSVDVNSRDSDGMTPLDHLRQQPASVSSDRLIRDLVSAGGICSSAGHHLRRTLACRLRAKGTVSSPGTSFMISDAEILLNTGLNATWISKPDSGNERVVVVAPHSKQVTMDEPCNLSVQRLKSGNQPANGFKRIFRWPAEKERKLDKEEKVLTDASSITSTTKRETSDQTPVPLRQRFSKASDSSPPNNKRPLSVRSNLPSPAAKKKLASGIKHGVMEAVPLHFPKRSHSSSFSQTSIPSPKGEHLESEVSFSKQLDDDDDATPRLVHKQGSLKYLCFGAPSLCGKEPVSRRHHHGHTQSRSDISVT